MVLISVGLMFVIFASVTGISATESSTSFFLSDLSPQFSFRFFWCWYSFEVDR